MNNFVNVFFFDNINSIGGVETFFYELIKKYSTYADITVIYKEGDKKQLARLRKYVNTYKWDHKQHISCKNIFCNYDISILDYCTANNYYVIIHADYEKLKVKVPKHPKITKYIAVSKEIKTSLEHLGVTNCELTYNPISIEKPKKILKLISATRLTAEKGKHRILKFAQKLHEANIPFLWTIFTNDINAIDDPNIIYMKPRLDIRDYIADADYLIQLSDTEAYCYSMIEALCLQTPVIITKFPVASELGVIDNENAFILNFDLSNLDVNKIYQSNLKFNYSPPQDCWDKYLLKSKSEYKNRYYKVKATSIYQENKIIDKELDKIPKKGEIFIVDEKRLYELNHNNFNKNLVEVIEEIKNI